MNLLNPIIYNPYFRALRNIKSVLDPDQKRRSILMLGLLMINAISDFLGLATIGALMISALQEDIFSAAEYTPEMVGSQAEYYVHLGLRKMYFASGADNAIEFLFVLSILIFVIFLFKNAVNLYILYIQTRFSYNISLRLNKKMFKDFYEKGYLFIKNSSAGNKVYSIVDIPMRFSSNYVIPTIIFTTELVVLVILGLAIMFVDPLAVLLLMAVIIPTFLLIYRVSKTKTKEIGYLRNKLAPQNYGKVVEAMNGYVDIKLSNFENGILQQYETLQRQVNWADILYFGVFTRINSRTNDIIFGLGIMVIFTYAYFTGLSIEEVIALLGIFAIAAYKFLPSINRMMGAILTIKNSSYVIDELNTILNTSLDPFPEHEMMAFESDIELDNISYQYPESEEIVLRNLNLTIKKGETIGIIGESGSGKTTLLKLILRLIPNYTGKIKVDNNIIDLENETAYQKLIGYVEQDIFVINGTVSENVAFGIENPDEEKIWDVLKKCRLDEFIKSNPEQLNMKLGENGVLLSGGQKQRIGIARALYKDSEILCFDEATSALDNETERAIVESINDLADLGKTVIIVAHRITTLEKCDRILELEKGKIKRQPLYQDLLKEKVLYEA